MKKVSFIAILVIAAAQFSFTGSHVSVKQAPQKTKLPAPATSFTTNEFYDVEIFVDIPCAAETVVVQGRLHELNHITINGKNVVVKTHFQPQGVSGISSVSGDKYQATGVSQDIFKGSLVNGQYSFTSINNFRIIGQGNGNNFLVHATVHTTVNANGTVTSEVENISEECR